MNRVQAATQVGQEWSISEDPSYNNDFTQVPDRVMRARNLCVRDKMVFFCLLMYRRQNSKCFPGQKRMLWELGIGKDMLNRSLHRLQKVRLMTIKRRGLGLTNLYIFHLLSDADLDVSPLQEDDANEGNPDSAFQGNQPQKSTTTKIEADFCFQGNLDFGSQGNLDFAFQGNDESYTGESYTEESHAQDTIPPKVPQRGTGHADAAQENETPPASPSPLAVSPQSATGVPIASGSEQPDRQKSLTTGQQHDTSSSKGKRSRALTADGMRLLDWYREYKKRDIVENDKTNKAANTLGQTVKEKGEFFAVIEEIQAHKWFRENDVAIDLPLIERHYDRYLDKVLAKTVRNRPLSAQDLGLPPEPAVLRNWKQPHAQV